MSNAMARSLGLVPPKETRTRTLGKLKKSEKAILQDFFLGIGKCLRH